MPSILTHTTAALSLALGIALLGAPTASAQGVSGPASIEKTEGSHIATRYRGRVGGGGRYYGGRHYRGGGGRYIAGGIAAGIAGALIYNGYRGSYGPNYYYGGGPGISCGELEYRCDRGEGWACRRLDVSPRC